MLVPTYNHAGLYAQLKPELDEAIKRVLTSGQLDWGFEVPAFEEEFADYVQAKYAVSTNSGTAALKVALLALGVGVGDEVITVPNSDISTTAAIHHVGAKAVWVDVEPDTMTMNPMLVEAAITPQTKALLPVHLYGHPADMPALKAIAQRHKLVIVEDACLALGASINEQPVGTWGDITCFSFAPSKHLGSYGSGGMAVTQDEVLADKMQAYAAYGQARVKHYPKSLAGQGLEHKVEGLNERLDELQAAMLRVKLPYLERWLEARRHISQRYHEAFKQLDIELPVERPGVKHSYRNYVIRSKQRTHLQSHLAEKGVASSLLYTPPLHLQPVYKSLDYSDGSFPVVEASCDTQLAIPMRPDLTVEAQEHVTESVLEAVSSR